MRGQIELPKFMEVSENEMRCPHLDTKTDMCHVQERHTADTTIITVPLFPPPFLASTPIIFNKLDRDNICLWRVISTKSNVIRF